MLFRVLLQMRGGEILSEHICVRLPIWIVKSSKY